MLNNTQRTAWLVGLAGALVLGMPAVGSGQGTVADDRAALEALYDATNGANWSRNDNWKTAEPLGQWYGVRTDSDGRVARLELVDNQLSGTIPVEIGNLTSLKILDITRNQLSGTIPVEIGNLTSLSYLSLSGNQLSGTIPVEIGNLTSLSYLSLSENQLSGTIPAQLRNLTSLTSLFIGLNQLSGTIPVEIGSLTSLFGLSLGGNQLSGTIPVEIGDLTSLTQLDLGGNQLSGTIPVEIGNLSSLFGLYLNDNQLSGQIPAALGKLTSLTGLGIDTTTGLCLAPDFDLASPFATLSGLPVCSTEPSGTPTPKDPAVVQMAVENAIAAATNGEGLRTGGAPVTVRLDALFSFPSSAASAVTYAGTTFSVSSTAPGVVSVSTTDVGPGVVLTPGADAGTAAVTVDARPEGQPAATPVASVMFNISVEPADEMPSFGEAVIDDQRYTVNTAITDLVLPAATGGDGALTYSLAPALPAGLTFVADTRTLSGTPTESQDATEFSYTVTDEDGDTATLMFNISVEPADEMPSFGEAVIDDQRYTVNTAITDLVLPAATGGDGALTYSLAPALPAGLTFVADTRTLSGTPTESQDATEFSYTVTDEDGDTATLMFNISVEPADEMPSFGEAVIDDQRYTVNTAITDLVLPAATGGDGALTYSLAPALPAGLTFVADTRTLSGTPTESQDATEFSYTVTDEDGDTATLMFNISVELTPVPALPLAGVLALGALLYGLARRRQRRWAA